MECHPVAKGFAVAAELPDPSFQSVASDGFVIVVKMSSARAFIPANRVGRWLSLFELFAICGANGLLIRTMGRLANGQRRTIDFVDQIGDGVYGNGDSKMRCACKLHCATFIVRPTISNEI